MKSVAIVGAGQAGAMAARRLRELGFAGAIDLYGDEGVMPYERPELSKGYVTRRISFEKMVCLSDTEAESLGVDMRLDCSVQSIDAEKRTVVSCRGAEDYGAIILATGGRARSFPGIAATDVEVLTLRSIQDADRLAAALGKSRCVAVIGGGWLGLELAATCRLAGADVHVYEMAQRLCARVAPQWMSEQLAALHRRHDVTLHLGGGPEVDSSGTFSFGGSSCKPDLVLVAIGMRANDQLAADAGIECDDGVLVDGAGRTTAAHIYAIGDCARYRHLGNQRRESWQNANQSAEAAARAILGLEPPRPDIDWFWSDQFDANIQMLGRCAEPSDTIVRAYVAGAQEALFFVLGQSITGCISINSPADISFAKRAISSGSNVDLGLLSDATVKLRDCLKS